MSESNPAALRVVIYAEGSGESSPGYLEQRAYVGPLRPGQAFTEVMLGPAHVLVRRCIDRELSRSARFQAGLRVGRGGRIPQGSDLLVKQNLRGLLTWLRPEGAPDLVVVLVDQDGESQRRRTLHGWIDDLAIPKAIGVAKQEFEAWLIADPSAIEAVLGDAARADTPPRSDQMDPRQAKRRLAQWCRQYAAEKDDRLVRLELARQVDLDVLKAKSRSFGSFLGDLRKLNQVF